MTRHLSERTNIRRAIKESRVNSVDKQPLLLIVDDEVLNQELLETVVERLGYLSMIASDGREALEKLTPEIDLVLLDVNMPGMTGLQVAQRIREHPTCAS